MWRNLKENRCPKCESKIARQYNENYKCDRCGFFCRLSRAREILGDLGQKEFDREADEFLKKHNKYIRV